MNWKQPKVYAVQHKSEPVRAASRSGGIFTAVSDWILTQNGIVYGCVLDKSFRARSTKKTETVCVDQSISRANWAIPIRM